MFLAFNSVFLYRFGDYLKEHKMLSIACEVFKRLYNRQRKKQELISEELNMHFTIHLQHFCLKTVTKLLSIRLYSFITDREQLCFKHLLGRSI